MSRVLAERTELIVDVLEQGVSEAAARLSISNIPLAAALQTVLHWPQERREGVTIRMPDRAVPWSRINDLYGLLYNPRGPGIGGSA